MGASSVDPNATADDVLRDLEQEEELEEYVRAARVMPARERRSRLSQSRVSMIRMHKDTPRVVGETFVPSEYRPRLHWFAPSLLDTFVPSLPFYSTDEVLRDRERHISHDWAEVCSLISLAFVDLYFQFHML